MIKLEDLTISDLCGLVYYYNEKYNDAMFLFNEYSEQNNIQAINSQKETLIEYEKCKNLVDTEISKRSFNIQEINAIIISSQHYTTMYQRKQ